MFCFCAQQSATTAQEVEAVPQCEVPVEAIPPPVLELANQAHAEPQKELAAQVVQDVGAGTEQVQESDVEPAKVQEADAKGGPVLLCRASMLRHSKVKNLEAKVADAENVPPLQNAEQTFTIEFGRRFSDDDGVANIIVFKKAPLGINFENRMPLVVKKVLLGGQAEVMGVEKGWVIKSLNGESTEGIDYPKAMEIIKEGMASLPKA